MGDTDGMQVLEEVDHLCDVEEFDFFGEFVDVGLDEIDKLSALAVLLHKIEGGLVLEGVAQFDDAGVLEVGEQLPLDHRLVLLLLPLQLPLLDLLQRIGLPVAVLESQEHIPVRALPQPVLYRELLDSDPLAGRAGSWGLDRSLVTFHGY